MQLVSGWVKKTHRQNKAFYVEYIVIHMGT